MGFVLLAIADIACVLDLATQIAATLTCFQLTCSKKTSWVTPLTGSCAWPCDQPYSKQSCTWLHVFECDYSHDYYSLALCKGQSSHGTASAGQALHNWKSLSYSMIAVPVRPAEVIRVRCEAWTSISNIGICLYERFYA